MTKDDYVRCAAQQFSGVSVKIGAVEKTFDVEILIPGTDVRVPSRAITVELSFNGQKDTKTFHEVLDSGSWRFTVLDPSAATRR